MASFSRRSLLGAAAAAAWCRGGALATPASFDVWSVDAGAVKVTRGLWPGSAFLPPGVHFENLRLRMPDGVHLNAILYMPEAVRRGMRVGTQLCAEPYRREPNGWVAHELAGQALDGFCGMFLDVRGSGGSEGVGYDEYTVEEYDDLVHVIDWLSRQPWSNGAVGMYGTSYSAFNSVWAAANYKPPALKAIFVRGGTDDRYTDDIHSPGGTLMMVDNSWALNMICDNASPGAPDFDPRSKASLDRWNTPPWLSVFLDNQLDGPHYRRGSLAPDQYGLLTTPTFLAGGYLDMYQNFVPRIMRNSPAYTQGILGPWHHRMDWPGPVLDWPRLQARWFGHFLNGAETGATADPRVTYYMPRWRRQVFRDPGPIPGEWRRAESWPNSVFAPGKKLYLVAGAGVPGALAELPPGPAAQAELAYVPDTGGFSESIGPSGYEGFYGIDAREDDAWGLSFDTPPLREPMEILGFVRANLFASASAPRANWIVRVNDVAPDGTSTIVTYGFLNGTHRHGHVTPSDIVPGEMMELGFDLFCTGYCFERGHRIRVVVTNAYFPVIWPSPLPLTTRLHTGGAAASFIAFPVLEARHATASHLPVLGQALTTAERQDAMTAYRAERDYVTGRTDVRWTMGGDKIGCMVARGDPAHAVLSTEMQVQYQALDGRRVETRTRGTLASDATSFHMKISVALAENGRELRSREWTKTAKRQFV